MVAEETQEAVAEAEMVPEEPEVQAAAEEVGFWRSRRRRQRRGSGSGGPGPAGQGARGLPAGRGNRPEEGRKPGNKSSSNSKSR